MASERSTPRTAVVFIAAALVIAVSMGAAFALNAHRDEGLRSDAITSASSSLAASPTARH